MPRSDLDIVPGRSELAALARSLASRAKVLAESEDGDDRTAALAYHLGAEAWRSIHDGERDAAGPIEAVRAAWAERPATTEYAPDAGLIEMVIE